MELRDALAQISEIRLRLAGAEVFRGYRSGPAAFSALLAVGAAAIQAAWIPEPARATHLYLALWTGAAALSAIAVIAAMLGSRRVDRRTAGFALEQLLPSLLAGGLVTFALARFAPGTLWLLPGLWQVFFSLGLFASARLLPRPMVAVAVFYLLTGVLCLGVARGEHALSPWAMGAPFGAGQLLAAGILYWTLERPERADG
jgi:hypothetical protein